MVQTSLAERVCQCLCPARVIHSVIPWASPDLHAGHEAAAAAVADAHSGPASKVPPPLSRLAPPRGRAPAPLRPAPPPRAGAARASRVVRALPRAPPPLL